MGKFDAGGGGGDLNFEVTSGGVPPGKYVTRFRGIEASNHDRWGSGLRWDYEVVKGKHKNETTSRTTKPKPTTRNSCGAVIRSMVGHGLDAGEKVDLAGYVGCKFLVEVAETESGGTRAETISRIPGEKYPNGTEPDVTADDEDDDDDED
jgi:hypothetical protein